MNSDNKIIGIITGMPRSRTAWFSELYTIHGFSFAYHEAEVGTKNVNEWKELLLNNEEKYIVDCNPGFFLTFKEKLEQFQNANIVIINRDDDESFISWKNTFQKAFEMPDEAMIQVWDQLKKGREELRKANKNILEVDYADVDKETTYIKIGNHLFNGAFPSSIKRFNELKKKIIVQNVKVMQEFYN